MRVRSKIFCWIVLLATVPPWFVVAQPLRPGSHPLAAFAKVDGRLAPREALAFLDDVRGSLAPDVEGAWTALQAAHGDWRAYVDVRNGRVESAEGPGIPWGSKPELDLATLESIARKFVAMHVPLFGVGDEELQLNAGRSGKVTDHLWLVDFDVVRAGLAVEGARVVFRIGHGNLLQFGSQLLPRPGEAAPPVQVSRDQALAVLSAYVEGIDPRLDTLVDAGSLHLLPTEEADKGYGLAVVWQLVFRREGVPGTWRARVDATTGEVLELANVEVDAQARGGVAADSAAGPETVRPMPFTDLGGGVFASSAGLYTYGGVPLTSTLNGQFAGISDVCGSISLTSDAFGDLVFGLTNGSNCTTPGFGGAGNTRSSRTSFYHVNRGKEIARGWLPGNAWLNGQVTANVNLTGDCNGFWNGTLIRLFQAVPGACGASGEEPGFILHEYGHGLDQNDGSGSELATGEAYGDLTAAITLHNSCVGPGFRPSNCFAYGDPCTACTGLRDIDWARHSSGVPHTVANYTQSFCGTGLTGPCGGEVHCESHVATEAVWDFANRDLPGPGGNAAWNVLERLWYLSRSSSTQAFACVTGPTYTSNGCNAGSWWKTMRAVDDDDGNLANGTPHSCNLFAAFNRHGIACVTDAGANTCFAGCAAPAAPTMTLTPGNNSIAVGVSGTGVFDVYRNELSCNAGFIKVADNFAGGTFTDTGVANGTPYYYQVVAHPVGNEACGSSPAPCRSAIPGTNLLQNGNFETGSLSPWFKFPTAAPGIVAVESCCGNQTPGGTWDGYIQPQGQYVELTQKVNTVVPGHRYRLAATVSTKGMQADLFWFSDVSSDQLCASTTIRWPAITRLQCDFTVPLGTTKFNVHLSGTAAAGIWTFSDDWSLTEITP